MKQLFSFCLTFLLCRLSLSLAAQPLKWTTPTVDLNVDAIREKVARAPLEGQAVASDTQVMVDLPQPDGSVLSFWVEESPIMGIKLSALYPEIKTYRLRGQTPSALRGRITLSPAGLQAIIATTEGWLHMEPLDELRHRVYYEKEVSGLPLGGSDMLFKPGYTPVLPTKNKISIGEEVFTFKLALLADGEYAEARTNGSPVLGAVIAAMVTDVNSINAIFETDLSIRFVLEEAYAYLNKALDPFPIANLGPGREAMVAIGQLIEQGIFDPANFDLGHLVSGRNIGGSAFVGVVGDNESADVNGDQQMDGPFKSAGGIGTEDPSGSHWVGLLCHEIGHMFNALHTFNGADGTCGRPGQYDESYAFEPGSGSTIMSYAGRCEDDDISQTLDNYFHIASIEAIHAFIQQDRIRACMEHESTENTAPRVFANPLASNYIIPKGTPFFLTGEASDLEDEVLSYCWEQYDLGNQGLLEESPFDVSDREGENGAPLFRSFSPSTSSTRTFPRWAAILGNASAKGELLPEQDRDLTFRLTVRDNHAQAGGIGSDEVQVKVDGNSGPFLITSFNEPTVWNPYSEDEITINWDVAKTNEAPIFCDKVNILFSADDGETFPILLGEGVANSGSFSFPIPQVFTTEGRILVQAADQIFFDVNNARIKIGGECYAEGSTIGPTEPLSSEWGTDLLELGLSPDFGTPLQHIGLNFTPLTPKANLTTSNDGSCFSFSYPTAFYTQDFQVNKAGEYTFSLPDVDHTTYYLANVYEAPYEPADPCFNWMASSSHFISGSVSVTDEMKVSLEANKEYVLVTFALTFGEYDIEIKAPEGGNAYIGTVPPNDDFLYTYLVLDQQSKKVVGFQADADLRSYAPGNYLVYGFSYPLGFSLDEFKGLTLTDFENKLLSTGFCGDLSDNFKAVEIIGNNSILPVALTDFRAIANPPNGIRLIWLTEVEENNAKFIVERSADGRKFEAIGEVKGAGSSFVPQSYVFMDEDPFPGINYYRLVQFDFDGTIERYKMVTANYIRTQAAKVFPNPMISELVYLDYYVPQAASVFLRWADIAGRTIKQEERNLDAGKNRLSLQTDLWPAGLYRLQVTMGEDSQSFLLTKQ